MTALIQIEAWIKKHISTDEKSAEFQSARRAITTLCLNPSEDTIEVIKKITSVNRISQLMDKV